MSSKTNPSTLLFLALFKLLLYTSCTPPQEVIWLTPTLYDQALFFSEGLAAVKKNGKWGYIDSSGKEVIGLQYDQVHYFNKQGLAVVKMMGKYGVINKQGKTVVPFLYKRIQLYSQNFMLAKRDSITRDLLNNQGKVITQLALNNFRVSNRFIYYQENQHWGIFNAQGKKLYSAKFESIYPFSEGGIAIAQKAENKLYIIDTAGTLPVVLRYLPENWKSDFQTHFSEGLLKVINGNKVGFVDKTEKLVIPFKYHRAHHFWQGRSIVSNHSSFEHKYGMINKKGEMIIPLTCSYYFIVNMLFSRLLP